MPRRVTNLQRILSCLVNNRRLCDDCLSSASGVMPRQTVNRLCRENVHLISQCDDSLCEGQCRKAYKILRFLPQPEAGTVHEDATGLIVSSSPEINTSPKVDVILEDVETAAHRGAVPPKLTRADFSRKEYLHANFNTILSRALQLPQADYLERLSLDGLMDLKEITSNVHAVITLKLTFALVDWLQASLNLTPGQAAALHDATDAVRPFESGFDLDSSDPDVIAEVKGNVPVKGGTVFGAAQLRGLTNDVLQMFGLPPAGRTVEGMSGRAKIRRPNLGNALKFLGVFDSPRIRSAAGKWMETFRKAHPGHKIQLAEDVTHFQPDTVYVVFLTPESSEEQGDQADAP